MEQRKVWDTPEKSCKGQWGKGGFHREVGAGSDMPLMRSCHKRLRLSALVSSKLWWFIVVVHLTGLRITMETPLWVCLSREGELSSNDLLWIQEALCCGPKCWAGSKGESQLGTAIHGFLPLRCRWPARALQGFSQRCTLPSSNREIDKLFLC